MLDYFKECIIESKKALKNDDIPIGSVVVFNNEIIGRGFNNRLLTNDVTAHAEIIAIKEAAQKIGDWRLNDCDLYVTLEPCAMCKEIIKESRIKNVYYLIEKDDYKHPFTKSNFELISDKSYEQLINDYKNELSEFFVSNCKR